MIPPLRLDDGVLELILANVRTPDIRRGDLRAQTAANHLAGRRLEELVERRGRDDDRAGLRGGHRLRRAAHARGAARGARRHLRGRALARRRRRLRRRRADRGRRHRRRRGAADRLRRHRRPGGGQRQLPAVGDALGLLLRAARAAALRRPRQRRHLRGAQHRGARGVGRQRAVTRRGGGGQRRDLAGDRRRGARRARAGRRAARAGPGDDEQPDHRRRGLDLLRDDRRRPGRERRRPRPVGRARRHVEHAQHADRGARARVPDARRALRAARRLRRRRRAPGRGRRRARGARARAGDAQPAHGPPPPRARGRGRRRAGACGENLLNDEELPPKAARELAEGDVVMVRTPGGGGYGKPG